MGEGFSESKIIVTTKHQTSTIIRDTGPYSGRNLAGPPPGWKTAAEAAVVHEGLPGWIDQAFLHLDYHCNRVLPAEWSSPDDPPPPSLATVICQNTTSLTASAVEYANQCWWNRLDEVVLAPLRREINENNDGVRVNIAPLQKAGVLAADVLAKKDLDKAIADRAEWRADERRWCREGTLPHPGWWPIQGERE